VFEQLFKLKGIVKSMFNISAGLAEDCLSSKPDRHALIAVLHHCLKSNSEWRHDDDRNQPGAMSNKQQTSTGNSYHHQPYPSGYGYFTGICLRFRYALNLLSI